MNRKSALPSPLIGSLLVPGSFARAQEIERGFDLFWTLEEFDTEQSFVDCPIPGLTFEYNSASPLTGCDTWAIRNTAKGMGNPPRADAPSLDALRPARNITFQI